MSLSAKLDAIRETAKKRIPAPAQAIMHRATDDLRDSGAPDRVIKVDATFPSFALENERGEMVRSEDLLGRGPLVLSVYRGFW